MNTKKTKQNTNLIFGELSSSLLMAPIYVVIAYFLKQIVGFLQTLSAFKTLLFTSSVVKIIASYLTTTTNIDFSYNMIHSQWYSFHVRLLRYRFLAKLQNAVFLCDFFFNFLEFVFHV